MFLRSTRRAQVAKTHWSPTKHTSPTVREHRVCCSLFHAHPTDTCQRVDLLYSSMAAWFARSLARSACRLVPSRTRDYRRQYAQELNGEQSEEKMADATTSDSAAHSPQRYVVAASAKNCIQPFTSFVAPFLQNGLNVVYRNIGRHVPGENRFRLAGTGEG